MLLKLYIKRITAVFLFFKKYEHVKELYKYCKIATCNRLQKNFIFSYNLWFLKYKNVITIWYIFYLYIYKKYGQFCNI